MTEKRIACFFTGGYTELNSMKRFLKKINDTVQYIQLCPNGTRKNARSIRERRADTVAPHQNGLTGEALIQYILEFVKKPQFSQEEYDAILIEDDKDDRFLSVLPDGSSVIHQNEWNQYKTDITNRIRAVLPDIPVILLYAAPEVEAWFLADWSNSFGKAYRDLLKDDNEYFSTIFRRYVNNIILGVRYRQDLESYGYFNGVYQKLSDKIQKAIVSTDLPGRKPNWDMLWYSKRIHGEEMLDTIEPEAVLHKCGCFFGSGFYELRNLS